MSFFGPNAVIDEDQARVYDYKEDRAELESSSAVSGPAPGAPGGMPPPGVMHQQVPSLQPLADMWKNASAPAMPQELEKQLMARQAMPPPMWMGQMPPLPPMGQMPPPGHLPPPGQLPPDMPPIWGAPLGGFPPGQPMPPMPGMMPGQQPMPMPWGYPPPPQQMPGQTQQGLQEQTQTHQQAQQQAFQMHQQPQEVAHAEQQAYAQAHAQAQDHMQAANSQPQPQPQPQLQQSQQEQAEVLTTASAPAPVSSKNSREVEEATEKLSELSTAAPYSLAPRAATAPSLAQARAAPLNARQFVRRGPPPMSEEYMAESELIRPNRRFRHLMTDHDKRAVMAECVRAVTQEDPFVDDFYFHVHTKLYGRDASQGREEKKYRRIFAKGESDGKTGARMRQQVARAVERAQEYRAKRKEEARPVRTKTHAARPRQALTLTSALSADEPHPTAEVSVESTLRQIEAVYDAVLAVEAHAERRPEPTSADAAAWAAEGPELQAGVWESLQVLSQSDSQGRHPFVALLLVPKGMKVFARSYAHLDPTRRLTVLTRVFVEIKQLNVPAAHFETFAHAVIQPLVHLVGESDLTTVIGLAQIADQDASVFAQNRVGQMLLTTVISRGELIAQESGDAEGEWNGMFASLFDQIAPLLPSLDVNDDAAWHFLAALALGSDLSKQRELVDVVRDKIFGQIGEAKRIGGEAGHQKIAALNLFLNVMGLDATFDTIRELKDAEE